MILFPVRIFALEMGKTGAGFCQLHDLVFVSQGARNGKRSGEGLVMIKSGQESGLD